MWHTVVTLLIAVAHYWYQYEPWDRVRVTLEHFQNELFSIINNANNQ